MSAFTATAMLPRCYVCKRTFVNARAVKMHFAKSKKCGEYWKEKCGRQLPPTRDGGPPMAVEPTLDSSDVDPPCSPPPPEECDPGSPHVDSADEVPMKNAKRARVTVEEVEDVEASGTRFPQPYTGSVAEVLGLGRTDFQRFQEEHDASRQPPWTPFKTKDEWELAEWLLKRVNKTGIDEFLKLPIV